MNRCCKIPCNMNSSNTKTLQVARKTDRQSTKSQKQTQNGRKHPQTNPDPWTIALRIIKLCYIIFAHMVDLRFPFLLRLCTVTVVRGLGQAEACEIFHKTTTLHLILAPSWSLGCKLKPAQRRWDMVGHVSRVEDKTLFQVSSRSRWKDWTDSVS